MDTCAHQFWPISKIYIQSLCADTPYPLEDLPREMIDRDWWRNRHALIGDQDGDIIKKINNIQKIANVGYIVTEKKQLLI